METDAIWPERVRYAVTVSPGTGAAEPKSQSGSILREQRIDVDQHEGLHLHAQHP